jgi:regulatory protein
MDFPGEQKSRKIVRYTLAQAIEKARSWCAYQERCNQDTRSKLSDWGIRGDDAERMIAQLVTEGFLNEERFARAFAGGKFRIKKWGRRKIVSELKKKKISEPCILRGLSVIEESEYLDTIKTLLAKRAKEVKEINPLQRKAKIVNFLISKGYEPELLSAMIKELGVR